MLFSVTVSSISGVCNFATNASGATGWPNLQLMQVAPPDDRIYNLCKWRHLMAELTTDTSYANWWPNLQLMQVVPPDGQIHKLGKFCHLMAQFTTNVSGAI